MSAEPPLTPSEERVLFLERLGPGTPARNVAVGIELEGAFRPELLAASLQALPRRHRVLGAHYPAAGARRRALFPDPVVPLTITDLRSLPGDGQWPRCRALLQRAARAPFELDQAPLLRGHLFLLSHRALLGVIAHEAVVARAGIESLAGEVLDGYEAAAAGAERAAPLRDYYDEEERVRRWLDGDAGRQVLAAWTDRVARIGAPLTLGCTFRPRPAELGWQSARTSLVVPAELSERARQLAQGSGVGLETVLLAAWAIVLQRTSGEPRFVVGIPAAPDPAGPPPLGPLDPFLFVEVDLSEDPTAHALLSGLHAATERVRRDGGLDLHRLSGLRSGERSTSHAPLFQAAFELGGAAVSRRLSAGVSARVVDLDVGIAQRHCDVMLRLRQEAGSISGTLEHLTDLYDPPAMAAMAGHVLGALEGLVDAPTREASAIEVLGEEERRQIVVEWNATDEPLERDECIHERIFLVAEEVPDRVAVIHRDVEVTYGALARRAETVAHHLRGLGVEPEVTVGVFMDRCPDFLVAVLGILKAGGAYVPLDPELPAERLTFMARDAGIRALVVREGLSPTFEVSVPVVTIAGDAVTSPALPTDPRTTAEPTPSTLCYVIYTSGSTGKPKGVQVEHRNVTAFRHGVWARPGFFPSDVVVAVAPFSFDMSGFDLYPALSVGGRVVIATTDETRDGRALAALLDRHQATIIKATPGTWRLLVEARWPGSRRVKMVSGGDVLSPELATEMLARVGELWNVYGPTEATVHCAELHVRTVEGVYGAVPIGRPLPGTRLYVLDARRRPTAVGVPGELYIGGAQVARGYLDRPELTESRFVANDVDDRGGRLYRTGDRARFLPDGTIEFLGRLDHQVKIRGHRVELQEISSCLEAHPSVQYALAIVREDRPGDQRLVAYVVAREGRTIATDALRAYLVGRLPTYMVPSAIVELAEMPETSRGKLDRAALPPPGGRDDGGPHASAIEPARRDGVLGGVELSLAKIWRTLLNVPRVRPEDDFFELGGHSLLGMQLLAEVEREFGCELPLSSLFPRASLRSMAMAIGQHDLRVRRPCRLVALNDRGSRPPLFCAHPISGQVPLLGALAEELGPEQPVYAIESNLRWPGDRPTVEGLARKYVDLIREVAPHGPYHLAGTSMGAWVAFEMVHALAERGEKTAFLGVVDCAPKFRETMVALGDDVVIDEAFLLSFAVGNLRAHKLGLEGLRRNLEDCDDPELRRMTEPARWSHALGILRREVFGPDVPAPQVERLVRTLMAHGSAIFRYRHRRPVDCPVTFIRNMHPSNIPYLAWGNTLEDGVCGWSAWSTLPVDGPHPVPGECDHWTMLRQPETMRAAAALLRAGLERAIAARR